MFIQSPTATPTIIKSNRHSTAVAPITRRQPPPAPHRSAHKHDKISKALFQEKENIYENKRYYFFLLVLIPFYSLYHPTTPLHSSFNTCSFSNYLYSSINVTVKENEHNLAMEEKLRRWKERFDSPLLSLPFISPPSTPFSCSFHSSNPSCREQQWCRPTPKPRPNPASSTSTSSLFNHRNSFLRPMPVRPASVRPAPVHPAPVRPAPVRPTLVPIRAKTAQEIHAEQTAFTRQYVAQDAHNTQERAHAETGNDSGNEGGDQHAPRQGQEGGEQKENAREKEIIEGEREMVEGAGRGRGEVLEEQVGSSMDISALLPSNDEEFLYKLGEWRRRFQVCSFLSSSPLLSIYLTLKLIFYVAIALKD